MAKYEVTTDKGVYEVETEDMAEVQNTPPEKPSMATMGVGGYLKAHPWKSALQPAAETVTGKSLLQRSQEAPVPGAQPTGNRILDFAGNVGRFQTGLTRDIAAYGADMVSTPATLATLGLGALKPVQQLGTTIAGTRPAAALGRFLTKGRVLPNPTNIGNKMFRSGLSKSEALRVEQQYGNSQAALVDQAKGKLNDKISSGNKVYRRVMDNAPEGKQINVRPSIEEAGKRLKRLGLITEKGNLTELGNSEIARDSVYGKLLDFYKSADSISGVGKLAGKESLTQGQMIKSFKADRETLVNKDQYTFLRDKLNSLYKNKPSDVDVSKVVNQFYSDGEISGLKGLQEARKLTREGFINSERFLTDSGDLKIANEANLSKIGVKTSRGQPALSKQTLDHIKELEAYIGHPIEKDATSINKINQAYQRMKIIKDRAKWVGIGAAGTVLGTSASGKVKSILGN